jgi:hypothetical protein
MYDELLVVPTNECPIVPTILKEEEYVEPPPLPITLLGIE